MAILPFRRPGARVLDVGSGAGKFCIVGELSTLGIFVGVEQRESLVEAARTVVRELQIPRIQFILNDMAAIPWGAYDSIYLYNPFSENLDESIRIDSQCELSAEHYIRYVQQTQAKLTHLCTGTRIVTLNGFGGDFPPTYKLIHEEKAQGLPLEVWERL